MTALPELFSVPSTFLIGKSRLRVLEPLDTPVIDLYLSLLQGTYGKPFIIEDGKLRGLYLGLTYVQSRMHIDRPDVLELRYTQIMMGFLLFNRAPLNIVMLGLGGGSLAKFCYRALPETTIAVVEIDPQVIALRGHFAIPVDDDRFRVICADAAELVAHVSEPIDVLLADAFDAHGLAHSMAGTEFLSRAHVALGEAGILAMNLAGERSRYADLIKNAKEVFGNQIILVPVKLDRNYVLFAFKQKLFNPNWRQIKQQAVELKAQYGLDFPAFAQKMARAAGWEMQ